MCLRRKRAVWPSSSNFVVITDQKTPKFRRYKRFRRYRRVVISDFFRMYCHSGPNFSSSLRRYMRFVVITDVVINDFYCISSFCLKTLSNIQHICVCNLSLLHFRQTSYHPDKVRFLLGRILDLHHLLLSSFCRNRHFLRHKQDWFLPKPGNLRRLDNFLVLLKTPTKFKGTSFKKGAKDNISKPIGIWKLRQAKKEKLTINCVEHINFINVH